MQHVGRSRPLILVVDKDAESAALIAEKLEDRGFETHFVSTDEAALRATESTNYDLVFVDYSAGQGLELVRQIRADLGALPEIALMAGPRDRLSLFECHQAGCCAYLSKPLDLNIAADLIERTSGISGKRRFDGKTKHLLSGESQLGGRARRSSGKTLRLATNNVGRGGFCYEISEKAQIPEVGQEIVFELKFSLLTGLTFSGRGVVAWTRRSFDKTEIGIEFVELPQDSESFVLSFADLFKVLPFVPLPDVEASWGEAA